MFVLENSLVVYMNNLVDFFFYSMLSICEGGIALLKAQDTVLTWNHKLSLCRELLKSMTVCILHLRGSLKISLALFQSLRQVLS